MQWVYAPYVLPLLLTALLAGVLAMFMWERRTAPGAIPLTGIMAAGVLWTLFYALEFISPDLSSKTSWYNIQYIGIVTIPPAWLLFTAQFTRRFPRFNWKIVAALAALPILTLILLWTNPYHHWMYRDMSLATFGSFTYLDRSFGPWFWVWGTYSYVMLGLGLVYLLLSIRGASLNYRRQTYLLITGALIPWVANALYVHRVNPWPFLDISSVTFAIAGGVVVLNVFRYRLLDVLPIARAAVVERMPDGVITFNPQDQVVDINPAALRILGLTSGRALGQHVAQVFARFPELVEHLLEKVDAQIQVSIGENEDQHFYSIYVRSLYDGRRTFTGRLAIVRDITEDKLAKLELEKSRAMLMASFEATADGMMVVNGRGKCIYYNQKFIEMWRISGDTRTPELEKDYTTEILDLLANPAAYYRIMNKLSQQPEAETYDVMELKDGRVFERYSCPQRIEDRRVGRVWSFRDITEQRRSEEKLRYLSTHDILTGLYNRVYFEEEINRLENSRQFPISIIMADVDGLKETNDVYGHQAGDALLRKASEILRQACRSEDMVARIGGDEFGILLPHSNTAVADNAVRRIQATLAATRTDGSEFAVSLSVGSATAEKGQSLRKVQRQADQAMYQVKSARTHRRHPHDTGPLESTPVRE